jgi:hypothetical protein
MHYSRGGVRIDYSGRGVRMHYSRAWVWIHHSSQLVLVPLPFSQCVISSTCTYVQVVSLSGTDCNTVQGLQHIFFNVDFHALSYNTVDAFSVIFLDTVYVLHSFWSEHSRNSLTLYVDDHLFSAMCFLQAVSLRARELELTSLFDHMGKEVVEEEEEEDLRHHSPTLPSQKLSVFSKLVPDIRQEPGLFKPQNEVARPQSQPMQQHVSTHSSTRSQLTLHA